MSQRIVILTGGIGSGKSVVAAILEGRSIPVYDTDSRAKDVYNTVPSVIDDLEKAFGMSLRLEDGQPDRKALASAIFSSEERRRKMESIVYPLLYKGFLNWKEDYPLEPFVVLESAIILSKLEYFPFEEETVVVLVKASREVRIRRAMERDSCTREEVLARIEAQEEIPESMADIVIDNSGSLQDLVSEVSRVFFPKNC